VLSAQDGDLAQHLCAWMQHLHMTSLPGEGHLLVLPLVPWAVKT